MNILIARDRMISVFYLIKNFLKEMGCEKYHQIGLKLSRKTFANCETWWEFYKTLKRVKRLPCGKSSK